MADKHKTKSQPVITKSEFVQLKVEAGSYKTILPKKFKQRKPFHAIEQNKIYAFIPGTILKILVKPGDVVSKGDLLLVFNAMKMNNEIYAPIDGVVKAVNANEGDRVPKTQVIIEIKEESA